MTKEQAIKIIRRYECNSEHYEACEIAIKALEHPEKNVVSIVPCGNAISRYDAIHLADELKQDLPDDEHLTDMVMAHNEGILEYQTQLSLLPPVNPQPKTEWIPVSERLPEELEPVNITWVNHEPEPYYHDIKDKNFVATGIHYRNQWYWYSTTCADYLGEYGSNEIDLVDDAIEIVAWMPLPKPYKPQESEG